MKLHCAASQRQEKVLQALHKAAGGVWRSVTKCILFSHVQSERTLGGRGVCCTMP